MQDEQMSLEELVNEYQEWIDKDIPIDKNWDEELNYISFVREEIHNIINKKYAISNDLMERLKKIDIDWRKHINLMKTNDFKYDNVPYPNSPNYKWWWHIDCLEKLNNDELSTL